MKMKQRRLIPIIAAILIGAGVQAGVPETDTAALQDLAARLRQRLERWQGPEYQRLKAIRTGYWGEVNADPERELMGVDENGVPIIYYTDNANAAATTRANALYPGGIAGYDLDGSTAWGLAVWDNGVANPNHPEFTGRILNGDGTHNYEDHANHTSGTLVAHGLQAAAKGMSFNAYLNSFDWGADQLEMTENADWLRVSSHSYHSGGAYGVYNYMSAGFDEISHDAPFYLIVMAAGNEGPGYDTIPSSNLGKNVLVVGAVNDCINYTGPGSVQIAGFSSRGPTQEGRIKPDIVGNGVNLYSTLPSGYTYMSGTSMATPNVAGTLFLLVEEHQRTHAYQPPTSAALKAVVIQTADECGPAAGPDYIYGWGLVNAHAAADLIADDETNPDRIQQLTLEQGQLFTYSFESEGAEPIRATMVWTDPPANDGANPALINDLDLRIVRVNDNAEYEPYVLNPESPSSPAFTGDNDVDNVEQVYIASPTAGLYRIEVTNDGPLQGGSQDFALVISGLIANYPLQLSFAPEQTWISDSGGTLSYVVSLINNQNVGYNGVQFWSKVILPGGTEYGPLFTSVPFNVQAYQTVTSPTLNQYVPAMAPSGTYQFIGDVGEFPNVLVTGSFWFEKSIISAVGENPVHDWGAEGDFTGEPAGLPGEFTLSEAWPNPFNARTNIEVSMPRASQLTVRVYDVLGRQVAVIAEGRYSAGRHELTVAGEGLASGVYWVRASSAGDRSQTRKVVLVR